jgi:hypothetical protein
MTYAARSRMSDNDDDDELSEEEHVQPINTEQTASTSANADAPTPAEHVGGQHMATPGTNVPGTSYTPPLDWFSIDFDSSIPAAAAVDTHGSSTRTYGATSDT